MRIVRIATEARRRASYLLFDCRRRVWRYRGVTVPAYVGLRVVHFRPASDWRYFGTLAGHNKRSVSYAWKFEYDDSDAWISTEYLYTLGGRKVVEP